MARRLPLVGTLVAVLLLALPVAASAEYTTRVEAPANATVTGRTEIHVRVSRDLVDAQVTGLALRPASGGEWVDTDCLSGCDGREPVFAFELAPRTGAPFADGPLPNGDLPLEARVSRELGGAREVGGVTLTLNVPGSAVGGLSARADGQDVRVAWSRAPEPDVTGYRIERCTGTCSADGEDWTGQDGTHPASTSSYTDEPGVGAHSYRIVTIRRGGDSGSIETVSSPVTVEVAAAEPAPPPGDGDTDGDDGEGDEGETREDEPSQVDAPRAEDAPDPEDRDAVSPDASEGTRSERRRADPPPVALGDGDGGIPELPELGDVFSGSLDYSLADDGGASTVPDAPADDDEAVLHARGDGGSFVGRLTDPDDIAVPIAGGLLITAIGLHLWRWLRVPTH